MAGSCTPVAERARRMLAVLAHVRPGSPVPLETLATAVGASEEELAADLETLSLCGVAPYSPYEMVDVWLEDDGLVYAYSEPPALDRPVRLSPTEAQALVTALGMCGFGPDDPLMLELAGVATPDFSPSEIERVVRAATEPDGTASVYRVVAAGLAERRELKMLYYSASRAERTERVVHPYALGNDRGYWYLSAFCTSAQAVRTFRLDRVLSVETTGATFEAPEHVSPPTPAFEGTGLPVAEVLFAASEDVSERDWPGASFEERDDGSVLARVPFSTPEWVARRVAARLGGAEVLSPAEARAAVERIALEEAAAHD